MWDGDKRCGRMLCAARWSACYFEPGPIFPCGSSKYSMACSALEKLLGLIIITIQAKNFSYPLLKGRAHQFSMWHLCAFILNAESEGPKQGEPNEKKT